jgi:DNA-binding MarR family transcriptional regulator
VKVDLSEYAALAEFRHQIRKFLHFSEQSARGLGIEPQQHQLLLSVKGSGETEATIGYLAERLQIRHHSAVELVDRLCAHGLIRRSPSPGDKRRVVAELTPAGNRVLAKLSAEHLNELRQTGPALVKALESLL